MAKSEGKTTIIILYCVDFKRINALMGDKDKMQLSSEEREQEISYRMVGNKITAHAKKN